MHFLLLRTLPITFTYSFPLYASLLAQLVKNLPAMWERWIWSLGCEDPLEKGTVTHASILAWRIPWTIAHGVAKSWTWRSKLHFHFSFECHWWALSTIATNPRKGVHKLCNLFQMFIHPNKYRVPSYKKRKWKSILWWLVISAHLFYTNWQLDFCMSSQYAHIYSTHIQLYSDLPHNEIIPSVPIITTWVLLVFVMVLDCTSVLLPHISSKFGLRANVPSGAVSFW